MRRVPMVTVCALLLALAAHAIAQDPTADHESPLERLARESLPLRTALHADPTLGTPLDRLLSMYRDAGQLEALVATYHRHLESFPNDRNARIVLVRLLHGSGDERAPAEAAKAAARHPTDPMLHYLHAQTVRAEDEALALELLTEAIALETYGDRIESWIDELLPLALAADRRDLIASHLVRLGELAGDAPAALGEVARRMLEQGLAEQSLTLLERAQSLDPDPEVEVELELAAAGALVELGRRAEAAERLDALLSRVTGDYWRRGEILTRRALLATGSDEEERLLADLRQRNDGTDVGAALDVAAVLVRLGRHREALETIRQACQVMPHALRLEEEAMRLFESLRDQDGQVEFLKERLAAMPEREDLALAHVQLLFATGRETEARSALAGLEASLPTPVFIGALHDVAKFLVARTLAEEAATLYRQILELDPASVEARKALAATLVSLKRTGAVRAALTSRLPGDLPVADVEQITRALMEHGHLRAARELLESHMEERDLALLLLRAEVGSRLGADVAELLEETRTLADSPARYRQWLEVAAPTWGESDERAAALRAEGRRLLAELAGPRMDEQPALADLGTDGVERVEAVLDECRRANAPAVAVELLDEAIGGAGEAPPLPWLRRLAALRERSPAGSSRAERELARLEALDPGHRAEYRARRAILVDRRGRQDLARELLASVNAVEIGDPELIDELSGLYGRWSDPENRLAVLDRALVVSPDDRAAWSRWLEALAQMDDEARLRGALRRVLGQRERLQLSATVTGELRARLVDSYWRTIHALLGREDELALHEAGQLLDSVERLSGSGSAPRAELWVLWTRAEIDRRLGRTDVLERRRAELRRAWEHAKELADARLEEESAAADADPASAAGPGAMIPPPRAAGISGVGSPRLGPGALVSGDEDAWFGMPLPDGLRIGRDAISSPPAAGRERPRPAGGPLPPFTLRWASRGGSGIAAIHPLTASRLLVVLEGGGCHCLDRDTGKLLWELPGIPAARLAQVGLLATSVGSFVPKPLDVEVLGEQFFCGAVGAIESFDADGRLLWRSEIGGLGAATLHLAATTERLFAFSASTGWVGALDPRGGKLIWEHAYSSLALHPQAPGGGGAVASGDGLVVWGEGAALLDAGTGAPRWRTDSSIVRATRISLESTPPPTGSSFWPGAAVAWAVAPDDRPLGDVAAWGASTRGGRRLAWAAGGRLALGRDAVPDSGQLLVAPTTLPIFGRSLPAAGTLIGSSGSLAVLWTAGALEVIDLASGERRRVPLEERELALTGMGTRSAVRWQGLVRGDLAYLAMPIGMILVNIRSGEVVATAPWPDELARLATEEELLSTGSMPRFVLIGLGESGSTQPKLRNPGFVADGKRLYLVSGPGMILCLAEDTETLEGDAVEGER